MTDKSSQDSSDISEQLRGLVAEFSAISHLSCKPLTHAVFPGLLLSTITFGHAAQQVGDAKNAAVAVAEVTEGTQSKTASNPKPASNSTKNNSSGKGITASPAGGAKSDAGLNQDLNRWREGHRVENMNAQMSILESERFSASFNNGERSLIVLENLALQRIAEAMKIDSSDSRWVISGKITEFRDQNYLWIERATRAAKIANQ
ncbi:MAG: hypothetical protein RLY14_480 [Planctomycetota bacterium]